jgi:hypothetical protein
MRKGVKHKVYITKQIIVIIAAYLLIICIFEF